MRAELVEALETPITKTFPPEPDSSQYREPKPALCGTGLLQSGVLQPEDDQK
jgi:hypothetical protein